MIITDTHTHFYAEEFNGLREQLFQDAITAGVTRYFLPNIDHRSIQPMLDLEQQFPGHFFPMMGLHPCSVKDDWKDEMRIVEEWLAKRKFVAVGEIGIDLYWDKTHFEEQKMAFRRQVELANQYKLPIVIHTRDSFDVTYELLQETKKESPRGIFHCFTGTLEQAKKAIDLGFYLGIGGVLTFKNSGLDKVLAEIDLEHIVLETDAPYLAPVPYRGKRNDPAFIVKVAERVSEVKGVSVLEVARVSTENSGGVFGV
ncbi:MAG: TatD family hydrolase [Bacteroidetes bacterium]|nr:TatD family hydrolase [Bacteroidota bacterium]